LSRAWDQLEAELAAWAKLEVTATFWWRDDDACRQTPALGRLADLAAAARVPLCLAIIPGAAEESLGDTLGRSNISVWQHGVNHLNRAAPGERKSEFPARLDVGACVDEIVAARDGLDDLLKGLSVTPAERVFVPPWNRISDELAVALNDHFAAISAFGGRSHPLARWLNTHLDIIDWRGNRGFVGEVAALTQIVEELRKRRLSPAEQARPVGLLTHHLVHDEEAWTFLEAFARRLLPCAHARWLSGPELLSS